MGDAFTPGTPPPTNPIPGSPRQYQYRPGYNLQQVPEPDFGLSFQAMRDFANGYDLLRRCLEIRKDELRTLEWTITVRERKNKRQMFELQQKYADQIREIEDFFKYPESAKMIKSGDTWKRVGFVPYVSWLSALLEDLFVVDALTIRPVRKRNGDLLALERIDGTTIRPLLGIDGRLPLDGPAYQQYVWGMPRQDFAIDEIIYRPYHPRNDTPYGNSLINQIIKHIQLAINSEEFLSAYFSSSSIPPTLFTVPDSWTPDQMMDFADLMNSRLSGNAKALREFNPVPSGTQAISLKPFDFKNDYMEYLATMTCVMCGVQPSTAGFQPDGGLGGKSFSQQAKENHDMQLSYTAKWLQDLFTEIIQKFFGYDDICFVFTHLLEREEEERASINQVMLQTGQKSLDELFIEEGKDPVGVSNFYQVGDRVFFLPDLIAGSKFGSVSVNLGQIGGVKLPDGTTTEDVEMPDSGDVITPNPNQVKDPTAKLNTSNTEAPKENKSKPKQPPKPKAAPPKGPTVNTAKSTVADFIKSTSDDDDEKRHTHELELMFIAAYFRLFRRVPYTSTMLNPQLALASFMVSPTQRQQLSSALYEYKRDVYIESYNLYADEHGIAHIANVPTDAEHAIRQSVADSVQSIVDTYQSDIQAQFEALIADGITDVRDIVDKLNDYVKQRNRWKGEQISESEVAQPWNLAIFDIDKKLGITDEREYWVQPDACVCDVCKDMVSNNPYTFDQAIALPLPAHPSCIHFIQSHEK